MATSEANCMHQIEINPTAGAGAGAGATSDAESDRQSLFSNSKEKGRHVSILSYLRNSSLHRRFISEMISTYMLVFAGCGASMVGSKYGSTVDHFGVATSFGLAIMIMSYAVGHISGAHMNPAVTIAFASIRHFPWKQVPVYVLAQVIGAILAGSSLEYVVGENTHAAMTTYSVKTSRAFLVEAIISYMLMFVISAVATDGNAIGDFAGAAAGATVGLNNLFAGPITGASMNPARSIGPAVISGKYGGIWVYIFAPIVGSVLGALSYNTIRLPSPSPSPSLTSSLTLVASSPKK